jgi:hypothetical protein
VRIETLFAYQVCFHESTLVACRSLEGVVRYPIAQLSLWNDDHLQQASVLASRLAAVAARAGDAELAAALGEVVAKAASATKHAVENKAVAAAERRAENKAADLLPYVPMKGDTT